MARNAQHCCPPHVKAASRSQATVPVFVCKAASPLSGEGLAIHDEIECAPRHDAMLKTLHARKGRSLYAPKPGKQKTSMPPNYSEVALLTPPSALPAQSERTDRP